MVTTGFNTLLIEAKAIEVLRTIFDPEIPVNIYDLGLVYAVIVDPEVNEQGQHRVAVRMTLTSPTCPVAGTLPPEVEAKIGTIAEVSEAKVELVWEPAWNPEMMSEEAKLMLNLY